MPLDPQVFASFGLEIPAPQQETGQLDPEVTKFVGQMGYEIEQRRNYLRKRYAWDLVAPLKGTRDVASERAAKEVTDPTERKWLVEEVGRIAKAQAWAKEKEYAESGFVGLCKTWTP